MKKLNFFDKLKENRAVKKEQKNLDELLKDISNSKTELDSLQVKLSDKKALILNLKKELEEENEVVRENIIKEAKNHVSTLNDELLEMQIKKEELQKELVELPEQIELETFGFYKPKYDFATSLGYKEKLEQIRLEQKQLVTIKEAITVQKSWTVDGSAAKGRTFTNRLVKALVRAFNNECEAAINKVKYSNFLQIQKRINKSYEQLNKLNETNSIEISPVFLNLKLDELSLAFEYEQKKQDEKEQLREQREREREEKALQKEINDKKKIIDKDITHYKNMLDELQQKLDSKDADQIDLELKITELQKKINEKETEKEELDYREAHAQAGYVYIISNIGSFGEDIVKIGVTRRLNPLERISELSSASVPFKYDIHALVFSYEAYKLEAELHQKFSSYRINKVNNRKEFFKISISDLEEELSKYESLTIDFEKIPEAQEYRESLALINN
ncbi:DUF4041 domain-containing protein [Listeria monocytogenes]|uniref:DUF4041 domain-containing protein n=1 Tax=Listeria monocytogenes TaxID=1639 RepID=UPI0011EAAD54|nr:DUF4041 domain-containing protein [Listeria monocytogenes]TYV25766.1 DUF4041 domain-containing protein [Listeria monocytogenes]